jgi:tetratricopeptide (TPR) repeat protein
LKDISTRLFKAGKFYKAEKVYKRIQKCFKQKDFRGNFCEEDDSTLEYRDGIETLSQLQLVNLTNLAVVALKQKSFEQAAKWCNEALEIDHRSVKALYLKAKALFELTDYTKAIEVLRDLLEIEGEHKEAQQLLQKVQTQLKQYEDKSAAMAKKMF